MSLDELRTKLRDQILAIAARRGARNIRVFGSVARGEERPESDLDLLVEMTPGRDLLDLVGLKLDLQDLLGCKVDVLTEKSLSKYIKDDVLKEAMAL